MAGRRLLAGAVTVAGLALMALIVWRILFPEAPAFFLIGTGVGAAGILSAVLRREPLRTPIDRALVAYVGLSVLSGIVHHGQYEATLAKTEPLTTWQPVVQVLVLTAYFYGASALLATERRVGVLLAAIVVAVSLFGLQAGYDHLHLGFGGRLSEYPSLMRWTGYTPLGLLFSIGFALSLPLIIVPRFSAVVCAASMVALVLFADVLGVYSRAATVSAAVAFVTVSAIEFFRWKGVRLLAAGLVAAAMFIAVSLQSYVPASPMKFLRGDFYSLGGDSALAYSSRLAIWQRVLPLVGEHPWLGVGPGNYHDAMQKRYAGSPASEVTYYKHFASHAHNMPLHIAAESGIPASIAFLILWWDLLRGLVPACRRTRAGALAIALVGALAVFIVKGMLEHLLVGLDVSTRLNFLMWTTFAAAVAVMRLPRPDPASRPGVSNNMVQCA